MSSHLLSINGARETTQAQRDTRFSQVAHLFHLEWHGIRSATSCLPGHKIGISADKGLDGDVLRRLIGFVYDEKIEHLIFQGYSIHADTVARVLHKTFRNKLKQYAVTHVTSTQFENYFEVDVQKMLLNSLKEGILVRLGSVKPGFSSVLPAYWPKLVINCTPNLPALYRHGAVETGDAFVPLENTIRKNLYTNILAALASPSISDVLTVNEPSGLASISDLHRCRVIGFQRGRQLFERMADSSIVLNCTLAECQPMTHLEALAVGTPCLTGRLGIDEFEGHPLTQLTEVTYVDNPAAITRQIENVMAKRASDPKAFLALIDQHVFERNSLAINRLIDFIEC